MPSAFRYILYPKVRLYPSTPLSQYRYGGALFLWNFLQVEPQWVILVDMATLAHLHVTTSVFD